MTTIANNYAQVRERIEAAAARAERPSAAITLIAVTKTWPVEVLLEAYEVGMRHFGENRTHELAQKRPTLNDQLGPDNGITWHQIGTLQSRQTNDAADYADVFHALDRVKIARRLSNQLSENGRTLPTFLEINVSGEGSKAGFEMSNWEADATQRAALRKAVTEIAGMSGLKICGLMTMAPWDAPENVIRTVFRRTHQLAQWLQAEFPQQDFTQLSMGMTDDFEIAIEEGATHIRVGRAIFGSRQ
jgi:pyridoxal phosphate enzyme (YggS family)